MVGLDKLVVAEDVEEVEWEPGGGKYEGDAGEQNVHLAATVHLVFGVGIEGLLLLLVDLQEALAFDEFILVACVAVSF